MAKKNQQVPKTFEDAVKELEQILDSIESGNVGLEESISRFERGTFLLQYCKSILSSAEKHVELIVKQPGGSIAKEPMEDVEQ